MFIAALTAGLCLGLLGPTFLLRQLRLAAVSVLVVLIAIVVVAVPVTLSTRVALDAGLLAGFLLVLSIPRSAGTFTGGE